MSDAEVWDLRQIAVHTNRPLATVRGWDHTRRLPPPVSIRGRGHTTWWAADQIRDWWADETSLLSTTQAAAIAGTTPKTVRRRVRECRWPPPDPGITPIE